MLNGEWGMLKSLHRIGVLTASLCLILPASGLGQEASDPVGVAIERGADNGPLVEGYGRVFTIEPDDVLFGPAPGRVFKVVFEAGLGAETPDRVDPALNNVARFLNMHGAVGVPKEDLQVALVMHRGAAKEALDNPGYQKRFGMNNPNLPLLEALAEAGVQIYLCAQSAAGRDMTWDEFASPVQLAFSAMTALVTLQQDGYQTISHDWPR